MNREVCVHGVPVNRRCAECGPSETNSAATPPAPESVRTALEGALAGTVLLKNGYQVSHAPCSYRTEGVAHYHIREGGEWSKAILDALLPVVATLLAAERVRVLEQVALHQCSDYNGGDYDWQCECGAFGHWEGNNTWDDHIRSLALADSPAPPQKEVETCKYQMHVGLCGAPIIRSADSYTGWEHQHKADWMHWAINEPVAKDCAPEFLSCTVCGKKPDENREHFIYESSGGHKFTAPSAAQPSAPPSQEGRAVSEGIRVDLRGWAEKWCKKNGNVFVRYDLLATMLSDFAAPADAKGKETK